MMWWLITFFTIFVSVLVIAAYRRRADALVASLREEHEIELRTAEAETDAQLRRIEREAESSRHDLRDALVRDLLPMLDSLDNGLAATTDPETRKGLGLVRQDFVKALHKQGVEIFQPRAGDEFDPQLHEAVDIVEDTSVPAGSVQKPLRAGARSGDRVLRPALVAVTRAVAPAEEVVLDLELEPAHAYD